MRSILLIVISCFFAQVYNAQTITSKYIHHILDKQVAAWNSGNLETFMQGYWHNDSLLFIGKSGVTYGYNSTLLNYKKGYPDTVSMGKLTFTIIHEKPLDKKYYFVVGKWHLQRSTNNVEGHFTLLFKKIKKQWVIVADHSS
jgi:hypothetical protein